MGYSHYWYKRPEIKPDVWAKIWADSKKITDYLDYQHNIKVKYEHPITSVKAPSILAFNGTGEGAYETFFIDRVNQGDGIEHGFYWNCVKTAFRPYDLAVCCVLLIFKHYLKDDFLLRSDGETKDGIEENWKLAIREVYNILGYTNDFKNFRFDDRPEEKKQTKPEPQTEPEPEKTEAPKIRTINFEQVIYNKRVECKRAWIVGRRRYRWNLKRHIEPCWVKNGVFVSQLSSHKKDFLIYVPADNLKKGQKYTVQNKDIRLEFLVHSVSPSSFDCEVLSKNI